MRRVKTPIKELCSTLSDDLARKSFFLLTFYFSVAAVIYYGKFYGGIEWGVYIERFGFQAAIGLCLVFLWLKGWRPNWRMPKIYLTWTLCLVAAYFLFLQVLDLVLAGIGLPVVRVGVTDEFEALLAQLLIAPIIEELFFRDDLYRAMFLQLGSLKRAVLFSSGFFMLAHMSLHINAFFLGLVACGLYLIFRSILPLIVFHAVCNFSLLLIPEYFPHVQALLVEMGRFREF